ncbi:MAG TPA: endolytic transglycosylase MltG [Patescibacteria group bacterium]|nr:endolytic transglycosylase MltG [Patescibacteria group bacterium]
MRYTSQPPKRHLVKRLVVVVIIVILLLIAGTIAVRHVYFENLKPVSTTSQQGQRITVQKGATVDEIAKQLKDAGLIRSTWAFRLYVSSKEVRDQLEAGTYVLEPSLSVPEIVSQLTHGKVATDLVTIIPGQRIDQIRNTLKNYGFSDAEVAKALDPATYAGNPALVDKPSGVGTLEGYIYPDSYQKTSATDAQQVVAAALKEMDGKLTPELRAAFAAHGLSTYDGLILASIIEQEVSNPADRAQAAQVFLKRISIGMPLGSDVTAYYGSIAAGKEPSLLFDSPYNTRLHTGLPPTPISNASQGSLEAAAHPATTDYLYFVAGDDGTTHFSHTLAEHEAATAQYCHKLCSQ